MRCRRTPGPAVGDRGSRRRPSPTAATGRCPRSAHSAAGARRGLQQGLVGELEGAPVHRHEVRARQRAKAFSASSGFMCCGSMNHRGSYAPMGSIAQSMGPQRAPISAKPSKYRCRPSGTPRPRGRAPPSRPRGCRCGPTARASTSAARAPGSPPRRPRGGLPPVELHHVGEPRALQRATPLPSGDKVARAWADALEGGQVEVVVVVVRDQHESRCGGRVGERHARRRLPRDHPLDALGPDGSIGEVAPAEAQRRPPPRPPLTLSKARAAASTASSGPVTGAPAKLVSVGGPKKRTSGSAHPPALSAASRPTSASTGGAMRYPRLEPPSGTPACAARYRPTPPITGRGKQRHPPRRPPPQNANRSSSAKRTAETPCATLSGSSAASTPRTSPDSGPDACALPA
jgi:hypothetical protein